MGKPGSGSGGSTAPAAKGQAQAREQASVMERDRSFLSDLFGAALRGDGGAVQRMAVRYSSEHGHGGGGGEEGGKASVVVITPRDVLAQFKDAKGRTALHFACQSVPSSPPEAGEGGSDDGVGEHGEEDEETEDDIVHRLLLSDWAEENHILTDPPPPDADGGGGGSGSGDGSTGIGILRAKDVDGLTPLMLASQLSRRSKSLSHLRVRALLRAADACPTSGSDEGKIALARSKDGATALHYASGAGASRSTVDALYSAGKIAARTFSRHSGTPLHWAAGEGEDRTETMSALIEGCGADVEAADGRGITPLILAAAAGNDGNAAMLVKAGGADRGRVLGGNVTVYHVAAEMNLVETLGALLLGRDDGDGDGDGDEGGYDAVSEKCCATRDDGGRTPLDLAAAGGHVECVALLLPRGGGGRGDEAAARAFIEEWKEGEGEGEGGGGGSAAAGDSSPPTTSRTTGGTNVGGTSAKGQHNVEDVDDDVDRIESEAKIRATELLAGKESGGSPVSDGARRSEAVGHKEEGNRLYRANRLEDAIGEYTRAIDADPTDATFYSNRSACLASLDRFDEALADAAVARHLDPRWPKGCFRLATARLGLGRYEDAAVAAWEGVQLDPENGELQRLLQRSVRLGKREHRARTAGGGSTSEEASGGGGGGGDGDGGKGGGFDSTAADDSDLVEQ